MVRWECANLFYAVAPKGLIRQDELPSNWGLLCPDCEEMDLSEASLPVPRLELERKPRFIDVSSECRLELLQWIAMSATRLFSQSSSKSCLKRNGKDKRQERGGCRERKKKNCSFDYLLGELSQMSGTLANRNVNNLLNRCEQDPSKLPTSKTRPP